MLRAVRLGWHVFPVWGIDDESDCTCTPRHKSTGRCTPGKHPVPRAGSDAASADERRVKNWTESYPSCNYGVALEPSGLVVVAPDSPEWLAEFERRGLPETAVVRSGGGDGHVHFYFRRPEGCPAFRVCKSAEYDLLSAGFVIGAASRHASGRRYAWVRPPDESENLPFAPDWVVEELTRAAERRSGTDASDEFGEAEEPFVDDELKPWWRGERAARKDDGGVDRSKTLFIIALGLAGAGNSVPTIAAGLAERDEALGFRKFSDRADAHQRYLKTAKDAVMALAADFEDEGNRFGDTVEDEEDDSRGQGADVTSTSSGIARGPDTQISPGGQHTADSAERKGASDLRPRFGLLTLDELRRRDPPAYLIEGVLVQNTVAGLTGPPGAFKTFAALDWACCVATGASWAGLPVAQGPVLYVSGEGSGGLVLRVDAWQKARGQTVGRNLFILPEAVQLMQEGDTADLLKAVKATCPEPPRLIVLDTLARCFVGGEENSAKDMGQFVAGAERLREQTGATVLVIHHVAKSTGQMRGSTALLGALHTAVSVQRDGSGVTVRCEKQKDAEEFKPIRFTRRVVELDDDTSMVLEPVDAVVVGPSSAQLHAQAQRLRKVLVECFGPNGATDGEWQAEAIQARFSKRTYYRWKKELVDSGAVRQEGEQPGAKFFAPMTEDVEETSAEGDANAATAT